MTREDIMKWSCHCCEQKRSQRKSQLSSYSKQFPGAPSSYWLVQSFKVATNIWNTLE